MPACEDGNSMVPGDLPEGEYQTEWFFGGEMKLTFDAGWTSREDSTGEFHASPLDTPENDIDFWEDVYPVKPNTVKRIKGVPLTAAGLLGWMRSSSQLEVSAPTPGTIGDLPATVVDVMVADDAVNDDPKNCPVRACVNFLGFSQWDGPFGIASGQVQRFYLSDVTYGGRDHLFVAVIYAATSASMKTLRPAAEHLIGTVRVPASPA
jgi:hypothetical protein